MDANHLKEVCFEKKINLTIKVRIFYHPKMMKQKEEAINIPKSDITLIPLHLPLSLRNELHEVKVLLFSMFKNQ
jgi:hypothetical protein